jgi:hypothetical protein
VQRFRVLTYYVAGLVALIAVTILCVSMKRIASEVPQAVVAR